jgi:hypothetical protein
MMFTGTPRAAELMVNVTSAFRCDQRNSGLKSKPMLARSNDTARPAPQKMPSVFKDSMSIWIHAARSNTCAITVIFDLLCDSGPVVALRGSAAVGAA